VVCVGGKPVQGRIIDIVVLRTRLEKLLGEVQDKYLNDNSRVSEEVRRSPTCETLTQFFYYKIENLIADEFRSKNPSVHLASVLVAIFSMDGHEMGAARLHSDD
jgi:hypothetical protein